MNEILAQAGRDAGYAALLEQAVPEFGLRKRRRRSREVFEEAVLDVELFGHAAAPDRLLDGTVRHPATSHILSAAAKQPGAAAEEGAKCKEARYKPTAGKSVFPCAVETWGRIDGRLDRLLAELAVLASQQQKDRGLLPTRWLVKWRTLISINLAMFASSAILHAVPTHSKPCGPLRCVEVRGPG